LIKLPPPSKNSATEKKLLVLNSKTSIQQLLSEPDPATIKAMKRCQSTTHFGGSGGTSKATSGIGAPSKTAPATPVCDRRSNLDDISQW
jgi:hypothetical protein